MTTQFHCYEARLHTLPEAPTLRAANHEQLCQHYRNLKVLNADVVLQRFGIDPKEDGFFESACHGVLLEEDYWRQCNLVWAWIDEKPVWVSAVDWEPPALLPTPEKPCVRTFRLSLLGGGQIKVVEKFEPFTDFPELHTICYEPQLTVQAEIDGALRVCRGVISHGAVREMATYAVLFPPRTPQEIADRTAATLRLIGASAENFSALLARGEQCCMCHRPLRDHVSTLLGIGPDCAKQFNLPHSLEAATRI